MGKGYGYGASKKSKGGSDWGGGGKKGVTKSGGNTSYKETMSPNANALPHKSSKQSA